MEAEWDFVDLYTVATHSLFGKSNVLLFTTLAPAPVLLWNFCSTLLV